MAEQAAPDQRIEPGSVNLKPYPWPASATDESVDAAAVAEKTVAAFNQALAEKDFEVLVGLFVEDGFWRDHVAASWHLRTVKGRDGIRDFLQKQCHLMTVEIDTSSDFRKPQITNFSPAGDVKGIYFYIRITTQFGSGRGVVRMVEKGAEYKIWTLYTLLEELKGHEEPVGPRRANGVEHGSKPGRKNWLERRAGAADFVDSEPQVLIIGKSSPPPPLICQGGVVG